MKNKNTFLGTGVSFPLRVNTKGELALVRSGKVEILRRWEGGAVDDLLGLVIGVRRKA